MMGFRSAGAPSVVPDPDQLRKIKEAKKEAGIAPGLFDPSVRARDGRLGLFIGLVLRHLYDAAADVAHPEAVEEVEEQADRGPDEEDQLRFHVEAEEKHQAADD